MRQVASDRIYQTIGCNHREVPLHLRSTNQSNLSICAFGRSAILIQDCGCWLTNAACSSEFLKNKPKKRETTAHRTVILSQCSSLGYRSGETGEIRSKDRENRCPCNVHVRIKPAVACLPAINRSSQGLFRKTFTVATQ